MIDNQPFEFADPAAYDAEINQGLRLSGEDRLFFVRGRLDILARQMKARGLSNPKNILDYGCGTGDTTLCLAERWPNARVVGVDPSSSLLATARANAGTASRCEFRALPAAMEGRTFDLVYCNGVFHHIPPKERAAALHWIKTRLEPSALFALWENNIWNPGTRWIMHRVPFDRDAVPLSPLQAIRMLRQNDFEVLGCDFAFVFPRCAEFLRPLERHLRKLPLGAQYLVSSRPESAAGR
jgi:SAM-dependent methyltransferase